MNKQLILLATMVAAQSSMHAFEADVLNTAKNMQALSECATTTTNWVPDAIKNAASVSHTYVTETVVPVTSNTFKSLSDNCPNVESLIAKLKPAPSRFESLKNGFLNLKDSAVSYFSSFNRPSVPSWQTTKNFAAGLKDSTSTALTTACESIKENAPLYFQAAKTYAEENPGKLAAVTVGSVAAIVVMYKAVKYLRNSDEMYHDYDAVAQPIISTFRK